MPKTIEESSHQAVIEAIKTDEYRGQSGSYLYDLATGKRSRAVSQVTDEQETQHNSILPIIEQE